MRYFTLIFFSCFFITCNHRAEQTTASPSDSSAVKKDTVPSGDFQFDSTLNAAETNTALVSLSKEILSILKAKKIQPLTTHIHPVWGLRLFPYGHVDTVRTKAFKPKELLALSMTRKSRAWGNYDGTGDTIRLSLAKYLDKFVYDEDYLNAKQLATNRILSGGTSFDNLQAIYPDADFVQFYFPGFDPKYDGMDWKALVLVFRRDKGKQWLLAIVHDQWRI